MTKEEIIAIYIEVSNKLCNGTEWCWSGVDEPLQLFAKLVAEKERAECANLCDEMSATECNMSKTWRSACRDMSNEIRARGDELCRLKGGDAKTVPLYTHPVKDLEDIDINITWNENSMRDFGKDELNFARAILRKTQEK